MARRSALAALPACLLTFASTAFAETYTAAVSISAGPLPASLQALERQTGIELLFDHALINGRESRAVRGQLSGEDALRQLLSDTELTVRRAQSGAWIVEAPVAPPLTQPDAPVPEILVVGQRTQNADIRRHENDVQPYTVATKAEILQAHRNNVDQFFASRITLNALTSAGLPMAGSILSEIDLRGLGSQDTLVLVDGRRMPSIPAGHTSFRQADINAIPLHAIERIEVLTGAAGGIHGFGALGGVVNVVLDRESRGVDLYVTEGISSRGDGPRHSVEARFGHLSRDGATDFMVFAAHSQEDTLVVGDRHYAERDRWRTFEVAPQYYYFPYGNSASVQSFFRLDPVTGEYELTPKLVMKPEYGGATLSSHRTYLPAGFSGDARALATTLAAGAGQTDFSIPASEARTDLGSNPRTDAWLANVRHRFGTRFEAYADVMILRSRGESGGESIYQNTPAGHALIAPESPVNPFTDYITVDFPIDGLQQQVRRWTRSSRYTGGLAAELPFNWRGTAEISAGTYRYAAMAFTEYAPDASLMLLLGDPSDLETNPFGDWDTFQRAVTRNLSSHTLSLDSRTRFRNQSLRLAGPVFSTGAGPATLTLLAEHRSEKAPAYTEWTIDESDGTMTTDTTPVNAHSSTTTSFYTELRSRIFDETLAVSVLRGLELQLALRHDSEKDDFLRDTNDPLSEPIQGRFKSTTYTLGAKISPTPWLMFRGSYATGNVPPPLYSLVELEPLVTSVPFTTDPKRGNTDLGADGEFLLRWGGDATLKTRHATTAFLGTVLTPSGPDGPRLAIDYSRIRRTRDLFGLLVEEVIAHEDAWPQRVERAPLTDADRAKGYTAGRVIEVDSRAANGASLEVDSVDVQASWPFAFLGGRLRLYGNATRQLRNVQKAPFQNDLHLVGNWEGPLRWRANGGFDWSTERLAIGANLQYFGSYLVTTEGLLAGANETNVEVQGSRSIPPQSYLDLHATWRPAILNKGSATGLTVDFGIVNVLDEAPPREASFLNLGPGYSHYGDPRQRRFELGLSCHF